MLNQDTNILIVGLGLVGGSYAVALSAKGYTVRALSLERRPIDYALARGWIVDGGTEPEQFVGQADIIICALYPGVFVDWVEKYRHLFKSGALLTDVTGVKSAVVCKVQDMLPPDVEFIAAHPMAGRERSGVQYADAGVFAGANYIVVPTEKNTGLAIETCKYLGEVLGFSRISELTPKKHDEMIAFLSQLTHCIAVALMNAGDDDSLVKYTGDSFRDLTRIAKINDEMWSELFLINKEPLLKEMEKFRKAFDALEASIRSGDREEMRRQMRVSTERRGWFDK
ncbi:MAG: prephenate dehydrogenase [Clostridia bacterium]|nr:prephenate dehydrogenase [Clostridia bacterium]